MARARHVIRGERGEEMECGNDTYYSYGEKILVVSFFCDLSVLMEIGSVKSDFCPSSVEGGSSKATMDGWWVF